MGVLSVNDAYLVKTGLTGYLGFANLYWLSTQLGGSDHVVVCIQSGDACADSENSFEVFATDRDGRVVGQTMEALSVGKAELGFAQVLDGLGYREVSDPPAMISDLTLLNSLRDRLAANEERDEPSI